MLLTFEVSERIFIKLMWSFFSIQPSRIKFDTKEKKMIWIKEYYEQDLSWKE